MTATHHDLANELPEYKQAIHDLKISNSHFRHLFDDYNAVSKDIHRIESGAENTSDQYLTDLRKKRLHLKDQLIGMLQPKSCGNSCGCSGQKMTG